MDPVLNLRVVHAAGPAESARLAARLADEANRPGNLRATVETRPATAGERSIDVPLAGQIALTFLSGGAAAALINLLRAWLPKRGDTRVEVILPDGSSLTLSGPDLTPERTGSFVEALRSFEPAR